MATYFHVAAGLVSLMAGYVALYSAKGAPLHRRAGLAFVGAMLPMSLSGAGIAAVQGVEPSINVPAGLVTAYLVITAFTAVKPHTSTIRRVDTWAMWFGFLTGAASLAVALHLLMTATGAHGAMAIPLTVFGLIAALGARGDARALAAHGLRGAPRLRRHLWRMTTALLIAAMSFFLGQADEFPEALRIGPLLALPVVTVLVMLLYWLRRLRPLRAARMMTRIHTAEST